MILSTAFMHVKLKTVAAGNFTTYFEWRFAYQWRWMTWCLYKVGPLAFAGSGPVEASSGKWCDTARRASCCICHFLLTSSLREKTGKLKFKSVLFEPNTAFPVVNRLFCNRGSCLFANSVEDNSVARVRVRRQRRKTLLVRIHSSVVIILRPRGMWANPRMVCDPISA